MEELLIELKNIDLFYKNRPLLQDICLSVFKHQPLVITGASGSGKTILGKIIAQQLLPNNGVVHIADAAKPVLMVSQQQGFRTSFSQRSYYQNRYEVNNDLDIPVVADYLSKSFADKLTAITSLLESFSLSYILQRKLNQLSNGEGKRLQIILALVQNPAVLVLDNPFIGIDKHNRQLLIELLNGLSGRGVTYILLLSADIDSLKNTGRVHLENGKIVSSDTLRHIVPGNDLEQRIDRLFDAIPYTPSLDFSVAIEMRGVTIQYGENVVLNNIHWKVNKGEKWLIRGSNGSGKSMLLSLINGDNPKAFGKDMLLFDKPKGSGESIWDLKNKIGYVSPEMHTHYLRNPEHIAEIVSKPVAASLDDVYQPKITCSQVIASGFNEEIGFVSSITELQSSIVKQWLRFLEIEAFADKPFYQVPLGLQRLLLLARAMVRNPALLILDEPCQGLDEDQTILFKETVEHLSNKFGNTILYVSHYDADVPANITHVLELEKGIVVKNVELRVMSCFSTHNS